MTTPADVRTDEEAFAACLAGRPVPEGAAHLTAFTDAVRAGATAPGRPNAALTELLATGLLTDTSEPSTRTAGHRARASRKRPHMILSTLTAKLAAAGIAAKAAAATGVVAVALTGAAASAEILPGQDASVFESGDGVAAEPTIGGTTAEDGGTETPAGTADEPGADAPDTEDPVVEAPVAEAPVVEPPVEEEAPVAEDPAAESPVVEAPVVEAPAADAPVADAPVATPAPDEEWTAGPTPGQSHGSWVSEGARNGWVSGKAVSDAAHARNAERKAARDSGSAPAPVPAPAPEPVTEEPAVQEAPAPAPAADNGHGNAGGNGNGNGGGNGGGNGRT